jgi:hypothetical protein
MPSQHGHHYCWLISYRDLLVTSTRTWHSIPKYAQASACVLLQTHVGMLVIILHIYAHVPWPMCTNLHTRISATFWRTRCTVLISWLEVQPMHVFWQQQVFRCKYGYRLNQKYRKCPADRTPKAFKLACGRPLQESLQKRSRDKTPIAGLALRVGLNGPPHSAMLPNIFPGQTMFPMTVAQPV